MSTATQPPAAIAAISVRTAEIAVFTAVTTARTVSFAALMEVLAACCVRFAACAAAFCACRDFAVGAAFKDVISCRTALGKPSKMDRFSRNFAIFPSFPRIAPVRCLTRYTAFSRTAPGSFFHRVKQVPPPFLRYPPQQKAVVPRRCLPGYWSLPPAGCQRVRI